MEFIKLHEISAKRFRCLIASLKQIEQIAYKDCKEMLMLQEIKSKADVRDYCESEEIAIIIDSGFYVIVSRFEIVDFATSRPLSLKEITEIAQQLKQWFGISTFSMDCREKTSYKILKYFVARKAIKIESEFQWYWGKDKMIEVMCSFIN